MLQQLFILLLFTVLVVKTPAIVLRRPLIVSKLSKRTQFSAFDIRGGSSSSFVNTTTHKHDPIPSRNITVLVVSTVGSSFLDKKKHLSVPGTITVAELKKHIHQKFPGNPPVMMQKLFYGVTLLDDAQIISSITNHSSIPIFLDMISGTTGYSRSMTLTQAIDAYVSTVVQQAYLSDKLKQEFIDDDELTSNSSSNELELEKYKAMFQSLNETIYENFATEIKNALESERNPEMRSSDTDPWRHSGVSKNTSKYLFAKYFGAPHQLRQNAKMCSILLVCSFRQRNSLSARISTALIPLVLFSQAKFMRKFVRRLIIGGAIVMSKIDVLKPLLPATYDVIAKVALGEEKSIQNKEKHSKMKKSISKKKVSL